MTTPQTTAHPRARLLWSAPNGDPPPAAIQAALVAARFALAAPSQRADLAIGVIGSPARFAQSVRDLVQQIRTNSDDAGIIFLGERSLTPSERAHVRRSGECLPADCAPAILIAAIRHRLRLRNLAEECGERLKSIATAARLGEFPPIETSAAAPAVLTLGAPGPTTLAAFAAAERVGRKSIGALNPAQAMRALDHAVFDCLIAAPSSESDPVLSFIRTLRTRPRHQDLPIIVLAKGALTAPEAYGVHVASELAGPEIDADELGMRIVAISRRARLVAAMRRFLTACAGDGVRDRLSGAFTSQFFAAHAARLSARAVATGRALSLIAIRLRPDSVESLTMFPAPPLTDAAKLIRRVTRAEDFLARLSHDAFIAALPATNGVDAAGVAARIRGVVGHAAFRAGAEMSPFAIAAETHVAQHDPDTRFEETIAAALAPLRAASRFEREA